MKTQLVLLVSIFLLVYTIFPFASATIGFGVSDYNATVIAYYHEVTAIECARIYNTGDEMLNVSFTWQNVSPNVTNIVYPRASWIMLSPNDSQPVTLMVTGNELGLCAGTIEFQCSGTKTGTGNPVVAGGTAHLTFNVQIRPPDYNSPPKGFTLPFSMEYLMIPVIAIPTGIGIVFYIKRFRHKPSVTSPILQKTKPIVATEPKSKRFSLHRQHGTTSKKLDVYEKLFGTDEKEERMSAKTESKETSGSTEPNDDWVKRELLKLGQMLHEQKNT